ncbi:hypothetical protein [Dokdonella sp.]|uniref:hypothetical protein n=1 Tax=Dokdonella sp. TaxID=2291710 RepID=UPI00352771DA
MRPIMGTAPVCDSLQLRHEVFSLHSGKRGFASILVASLLFLSLVASGDLLAGTPPIGAIDTNLVPNASFQGVSGSPGGTGTVNGDVPTLWRAFSQGTGVLNLERLDLAANTLFPGSPPTQAVKISVATFGTDQALDSIFGLFPIQPGLNYDAKVYARSGNADNSSQGFTMSILAYDATVTFTGNAQNVVGNATSTWTQFSASQLTGGAPDRFGKLIFRFTDDAGEDSVILAFPEVQGPPASNTVPNPGFVGNSGGIQGTVTGTVPDNWRAFSVGAGTINLTTVPLAANELFSGSPPTNAMRVQVTGGDGNEGFDHELVRAALHAGYFYRGEVYMRSGNAGMAPQDVSIGMPIFDASGNFTGLAPGTINTTVGPEWSLLASNQFGASTGQTTNLAFRPGTTGDSVFLIAAPRIVDPTGLIFTSSFD